MKTARLIITCFLPALVAGCSLFGTPSFSPLEMEYPRGLEPPDMFRLLEDRHENPTTLWAGGKITLSGGELKGSKFFHSTLLYQEPDRIRLRGSRMITSTLFEFIINGERAAFLLNRDKLWFEGETREMREREAATLGMDPARLPLSLLVHQEFLRLFREGRLEKWREGRDDYLFVGQKEADSKVAFLVTKKDLLIREAALYNAKGRLSLKLSYRSYDYFDGMLLPRDLEAYIPASGMKARISVKEYKFPPVFKDAVFRMSPPPGFQRRPLRELWEPSGTGMP